jgi:hypothetical protein
MIDGGNNHNNTQNKGVYGTMTTKTFASTIDDDDQDDSEKNASSHVAPALSKENDDTSNSMEYRRLVYRSITKLTVLLVVVTIMNLLKGGTSKGGGPMGLPTCGQGCFWMTNAVILCVITSFAIWVRHGILTRLAQEKDEDGGGGVTIIISDIAWNEENTITFPALAIVAGLAAGLFGIGGGIVKGPLMLALGVHPAVASATSACMILFTATTSTVRYTVFGLLNYSYSIASFTVGFLATLAGQTIMTRIMSHKHSHNRHSYIAYSIGIAVALSAIAMGIESIVSLIQTP